MILIYLFIIIFENHIKHNDEKVEFNVSKEIVRNK